MSKIKQNKEINEKPKYNIGQNVGFMIRLAWTSKEKKVLVQCICLALLVVGLNLLNLYASPTILGVVERHASLTELLKTIGFFCGGILLLSTTNTYVKVNVLTGRVSVRAELVNMVNKKATTTSYPNLSNDNFLKMHEKVCVSLSSNHQATEAIWETLTDLLSNLIGFSIYLGLLSHIQMGLLLLILGTMVVNYFITNQVNEYGYRHREVEGEYIRQIRYIFQQSERLGAAKDIRIFGMKPWLDELRKKAMSAYFAFHDKVQGKYFLGKIADLVLTFLRNGVAYGYLLHLVLQGHIGAMEFLLYFQAISGFSEWVSGILGSVNTLHKQSLEISVLREFLEYQEPFRFEEGKKIQSRPQGIQEIRLENVSFRYPEAKEDTLSKINLTLHPGEKLAVVGLNGAGKTTLIKLICGFLDPTEGRILLDGEDIRNYNRRDYYTLFSAVFQEFSLLAGSIATNVAQSEDDIDMEKVRSCVEKAGLKEKIESLKDGYETLLNREVYEDAILLSGGEIQRLMLARALYKDAPFVMLDEPTAALDPIAESDMYQKYHEMTKDKSSIYISHRLASTRFCNRIILIDQARICEEGTHEELLKRNGKYAHLYEIQSKYYKEEREEDEEKTIN